MLTRATKDSDQLMVELLLRHGALVDRCSAADNDDDKDEDYGDEEWDSSSDTSEECDEEDGDFYPQHHCPHISLLHERTQEAPRV